MELAWDCARGISWGLLAGCAGLKKLLSRTEYFLLPYSVLSTRLLIQVLQVPLYTSSALQDPPRDHCNGHDRSTQSSSPYCQAHNLRLFDDGSEELFDERSVSTTPQRSVSPARRRSVLVRFDGGGVFWCALMASKACSCCWCWWKALVCKRLWKLWLLGGYLGTRVVSWQRHNWTINWLTM
jgi:hypothetical protein